MAIKKIVKNVSNQPLYLNLFAGRSVKLRAKGTAEIDEGDFQSPEVQHHMACGHLVVIGERAPESTVTQPED